MAYGKWIVVWLAFGVLLIAGGTAHGQTPTPTPFSCGVCDGSDCTTNPSCVNVNSDQGPDLQAACEAQGANCTYRVGFPGLTCESGCGGIFGTPSPTHTPTETPTETPTRTATIPVAPILYWVGGSGVWADSAHWSTTSGGSGGDGVPSYATYGCRFDELSGTGTFTIDATAGGDIGCGGTGLEVSGAWTQHGTLQLGGSHLTVPQFGAVAGSRTFFTVDPGSSTVTLSSSGLWIGPSGGSAIFNKLTFYNLELGAGTWSMGDGAIVTGSLTLQPDAMLDAFELNTLIVNTVICTGTAGHPITLTRTPPGSMQVVATVQPQCTWIDVDHVEAGVCSDGEMCEYVTARAIPWLADSHSNDNGGNINWCFGDVEACPVATYTPTPAPTVAPGCLILDGEACAGVGPPGVVPLCLDATASGGGIPIDQGGCDMVNGMVPGCCLGVRPAGFCGSPGDISSVCADLVAPTQTPTSTPTVTPTPPASRRHVVRRYGNRYR